MMTKTEILLTSVAALIIGIIIVHYEDSVEAQRQAGDSAPESVSVSSPPPVGTLVVTPITETAKTNPVLTQLKQLVVSETAVTVAFWLEAPNKKQFSTEDRVTLYYQIEEDVLFANPGEFYLTLFNISPAGKLSILLMNESVNANQLYTLPTRQPDWQPEQVSITDQRLRLEAGNEYFKAIVTTEPIASWLKFLATDITVPSQRDKLLAAQEMWINVN